MRTIEMLKLPNGSVPFKEWLESLTISIQAKVMIYIGRVAAGGSKKNIRSLGDGIFEIKLKVGGGVRIYFTEVDGEIVLLLCGGDKSSQSKDVKKAKEYWRTYVQK